MFAIFIGWIWSISLFSMVKSNPEVASHIYTLVRSWVSVGATTSATILGFLIAGFTVFATVSKPKLFVTLAKLQSLKNPAESEFKLLMANFVNAFVHYLSYCSISLLVQFGASPYGFLSVLVNNKAILEPSAKPSIAIALLWFYFVWTVIVLLKLKSFVWNVYGTVMLVVSVEPDEPKQKTAE